MLKVCRKDLRTTNQTDYRPRIITETQQLARGIKNKIHQSPVVLTLGQSRKGRGTQGINLIPSKS